MICITSISIIYYYLLIARIGAPEERALAVEAVGPGEPRDKLVKCMQNTFKIVINVK